MAGSSWTNQVVTTLVVSSGGAATGIFVYNGTPAHGNNPIFTVVAPGVTQDPFGNTVQALVNIGPLGGAHSGWDANGRQYLADATPQTRLFLDPNTSMFESFPPAGSSSPPTVTIAPTAGGTDNFGHTVLGGITAYGSGTNTAQLIQAALALTGTPGTNTTSFAETIFGTFGNAPVITVSGSRPVFAASGYAGQISALNSTGTNLETWQTFTPLLNGWAAAAGVQAPQYKFGAEHQVMLRGSLDGSAATAATFFTVPAAYRPPSATQFFPAGANGGVPAGQAPFGQVSTAGSIAILGFTVGTAGAHVAISGEYSLDS